MGKSYKLSDDNKYIDFEALAINDIPAKTLMSLYNDTSADDIKDLLDKKEALCKPYLKYGKLPFVILPGGWRGINFGVTIAFWLAENEEHIMQTLWLSNTGIYSLRTIGSYKSYTQVLFSDI